MNWNNNWTYIYIKYTVFILNNFVCIILITRCLSARIFLNIPGIDIKNRTILSYHMETYGLSGDVTLLKLLFHRGGGSVRIVFVSFWKGVSSKRKEFAPFGSKFFSLRVDPFSEGAWCAGKQTRNHKSCVPFKNRKTTKFIQSPWYIELQ